MLKEYAVRPSVMGQSWEQFRYLLDAFGFERGRLMLRLPDGWEKQVIQAAEDAGVREIDILRIIEKLRGAKSQRALINSDAVYESATDWLDNAIAHHQADPFHAIINDATVPGQDYIITTDDIDAEHPIWHSTHDWEIPRSARNLADCMKPLIRVAKQISIVDPFFDLRPGRGHYVDTLTEILTDLGNSPARKVQFQIHYRTDDRRPPVEFLEENAGRWVDGIIPNGIHLELFEWGTDPRGEVFHDRHLLCDCGGLSIGHGFDAAGDHGNALVSIHSYAVSQQLKAKFDVDSSPYHLAQPILSISSDGKVTRLLH